MLGSASDYKDYEFQKLSIWGKIVELTLIVNNEIWHNPILLILMFGATITRLLSVLFSTYLLLWIQTFAKPIPEFNDGNALITRDEGKTIYQNVSVISVLVSAFVFPFVGTICDTYSPRIIIPFSFVFRAIMTVLFV